MVPSWFPWNNPPRPLRSHGTEASRDFGGHEAPALVAVPDLHDPCEAMGVRMRAAFPPNRNTQTQRVDRLPKGKPRWTPCSPRKKIWVWLSRFLGPLQKRRGFALSTLEAGQTGVSSKKTAPFHGRRKQAHVGLSPSGGTSKNDGFPFVKPPQQGYPANQAPM